MTYAKALSEKIEILACTLQEKLLCFLTLKLRVSFSHKTTEFALE